MRLIKLPHDHLFIEAGEKIQHCTFIPLEAGVTVELS